MLWLSFIIFPLVIGEDSPCPADKPCTPARSCPMYLEFVELKKTNRTEFERLKPSIIQAVCNSARKKLCCPDTTSNPVPSPNTTPNPMPSPPSSPDVTTSNPMPSPDTTPNPLPSPPSYPDVTTSNPMLSPGWIPSSDKGECGLSDLAFIVGGETTKLGEMPWAAMLGATGNKGFRWNCGGAVINNWFVLTAAHCNPVTRVRLGEWRVIDPSKPNRRRALVFSEEQRERCGVGCQDYALADGTRDCTPGGTGFRYATERTTAHCGPPFQEFGVMKTIIHPGYRILGTGVSVNDIALIKLSRPAILYTEGDSLVSPICLPPPGQEIINSGNGTVIGWGKTYVNDRVVETVNSARQKKLVMPIIDNAECEEVMSDRLGVDIREDINEEDHLCAGGVKGQDSCGGDSGGPFIVKKDQNSPYTLAGIVSFGTGRCGIGAPSVFSRISTKIEWIKQNLV